MVPNPMFLNRPRIIPVPEDQNFVEKPTEVKFSTQGEDEFVFNAAFSGWHSSALAVSLDEDEKGTDVDDEEIGEESDEGEDSGAQLPGGFPSARARVGLARFGLAARGRVGQQ
jgi:hypothetical protein